MRKLSLLVSAIISALIISGILSCSKDPYYINYTWPDMTANLTATTSGGAQVFTFQISDSGMVGAINSQGITDVSRVLSADLTGLQAVVTSPSGGNFNQVGSINAYYKTADNLQDSTRLIYTDTIPTGAGTMNLKLFSSDVLSNLTKTAVLVVIIAPNSGGIGAESIKLTQGTIKMKIRNI